MSRYIQEHRGRFGVEPICRTLGVSASACYKRATGERSERAIDDERLLLVIRELHEANYFAYVKGANGRVVLFWWGLGGSVAWFFPSSTSRSGLCWARPFAVAAGWT